ncbi:MAG: hypothetical protein IKA85_01455 [Clostridia bacterium]|nr:hypothetical protein [Clostridia bacterium]
MLENLLKDLNAEIESPYLEEAYNKAIKDVNPFYLTEEYLEKIFECKIIKENCEILRTALKGVNKVENLALFVKILYHIIDLGRGKGCAFTKLVLPTAPENSEYSIAYDCASAFAILGHMPKYKEQLNARGVEDRIVYDTISLMDINITMGSEKAGKPICDHETFISYGAYIYTETIWIERFRFQLTSSSKYPIYVFRNKVGDIKIMMRDVYVHESGYLCGSVGIPDTEPGAYAELTEGDDYYEGYFVDNKTNLVIPTPQRISKSEWELLLKPNEDVLKIHVPFGGNFTAEVFDKTLKKGEEVMKAFFPDKNIKGICATSWFFTPALKGLLKPTSNIMAFRNCFTLYPKVSQGYDVFEFVFENPIKSYDELDVDKLPEDNSLRRGVKELFKKGVYFPEFGAFRPFNNK